MLADFDRAVTAVAAQPSWLRFRYGGRVRRHVPDFFLVRADHSVLVVNVKPADQAVDPKVAEALEWPGRLAIGHGWVRQLEAAAGTTLLRTGPDGTITLTLDGQQFARDVAPVLDMLAATGH
jgi:hypothetical protein